jgi:peptidoglycan/LPS O-acetylase OafA/YrhL
LFTYRYLSPIGSYTLPGFASGWIGKKDISYGLFLYHGIPLSLLVEWELSGSIFYMGVVGGVTIVLAMFSFHFVESPAMAWAKRRNNAVTLRESLIRANIATIYTHKA